MPHKKQNLPEKICAHCARPFAWRKKWSGVWEQVRYCSERCRKEARTAGGLSHPEVLTKEPR